MDLLRSCYRTQAILCRSGEQHEITWYFAEPGARYLECPSAVSSRVWDDWKTVEPLGPRVPLPVPFPPVVGEVIGAPRSWYNGRNPVGFHGRAHLGDCDAFANGALDCPIRFVNVCRDIHGGFVLSGQVAAIREPCGVVVPGACHRAPCCFYGTVTGDVADFNTPNLQYFATSTVVPAYGNQTFVMAMTAPNFAFDDDPSSPNYLEWQAGFDCGNPLLPSVSGFLSEDCGFSFTFHIPVNVAGCPTFAGTVHLTVRRAPDGEPLAGYSFWSGAGRGVAGPPVVNGATTFWSGSGTGERH